MCRQWPMLCIRTDDLRRPVLQRRVRRQHVLPARFKCVRRQLLQHRELCQRAMRCCWCILLRFNCLSAWQYVLQQHVL